MKFFLIAILVFLITPYTSAAQEPPSEFDAREVRGQVLEISDYRKDENGVDQAIFTVRGDHGAQYEVDTAKSYIEGLRYDLEVDDRVILQVVRNADGSETAYLSDVVRTNALAWMAVCFVLLILAVGLWRGLLAVLGLAVTIGIVFGFLFPRILTGSDPLLTTLAASILILAVNIPISHGVSKITLTAFLGTIGGLGLSVIFAKWFVAAASLSGLASEEAIFFSWDTAQIDPRGILLSAIILGAVGVFDDVAITQAESVSEIAQANPTLKARELYVRAMRIGRHHIASMVNTLVLAYVAVAMPLFLLFMKSSASWMNFLNTELVAEEIVRTLAGTSALILTVPLTTWLASLAAKRESKPFDTKKNQG